MDIKANSDLNRSNHFGMTHIVVENIYQYIKSIDGWNLDLIQYENGRFLSDLKIIQDKDIQVLYDKSIIGLNKKASCDYDWVVSFPAEVQHSSPHFWCDGHYIQVSSMLVSNGRNLPELSVPKNSNIITIGFNQSYIENLVGDYILLEKSLVRPILHQFEMDMLKQMKNLFDTVSNNNDFTNLINLFLKYFFYAFLDESTSIYEPPSLRKKIVDRTLQLMVNEYTQPLTITEICNHVGVSRRKLQYCFQEVLGINPIAYLKIIRLNQVHQQLLKAESSIQDIAFRYGFWHLGHFSSDYKKLFAETPSMTMLKAKY